MDTLELIGTILLYFILPVLVIFGTMFIIRRKRDKDSGRISSTTDKNAKTTIKDVKEEESYDARHKKANDPSQRSQTGPGKDKNMENL